MGVADLLVPALVSRRMRVDTFQTAGTFTWTCPAGVTYAIAHLIGGGGGSGGGGYNIGTSTTGGGAGGSSTALGGTAVGGNGGTVAATSTTSSGRGGTAGAANSGKGAQEVFVAENSRTGGMGGDGAEVWCGSAVTAGTGYTVVVGAAGSAGSGNVVGGSAGGSGLVEIWYEK